MDIWRFVLSNCASKIGESITKRWRDVTDVIFVGTLSSDAHIFKFSLLFPSFLCSACDFSPGDVVYVRFYIFPRAFISSCTVSTRACYSLLSLSNSMK